jgi:hypothetical protein
LQLEDIPVSAPFDDADAHASELPSIHIAFEDAKRTFLEYCITAPHFTSEIGYSSRLLPKDFPLGEELKKRLQVALDSYEGKDWLESKYDRISQVILGGKRSATGLFTRLQSIFATMLGSNEPDVAHIDIEKFARSLIEAAKSRSAEIARENTELVLNVITTAFRREPVSRGATLSEDEGWWLDPDQLIFKGPFAHVQKRAAKLLALAKVAVELIPQQGIVSGNTSNTAASTEGDYIRERVAAALSEIEVNLVNNVWDRLSKLAEDFETYDTWLQRSRVDARPVTSIDKFRGLLDKHGFVLSADMTTALQNGDVWNLVVGGSLSRVILKPGFMAYINPAFWPPKSIGKR